MTQIPSIAIFVDPKREATPNYECKNLEIIIISILAIICDTSFIDIPILDKMIRYVL